MRASSQGVHCGRLAALLEDDTERNREDATDQEFPARHRRRLRITWQEDVEVHEDTTVRSAEALIHNLAQRIGAIPVGGLVPLTIQRQRWSPLNVPIIWGAAGVSPSILLIEWLVSRASSIHAPIQFHGGQSSVNDSIRDGIARSDEGVARHNTRRVVWMVEEPRVSRNPTRTTFVCKSTGIHLP